MMDHRKELARRLSWELSRRNLLPQTLAERASVSFASVESYLAGSKEIIFEELCSISRAMNVNVFKLISNNYVKTNLLFRGATEKCGKLASDIENIFLNIEKYVPELNIVQVGPPVRFSESYEDVYAAVHLKVQEFKKAHDDDVVKIVMSCEIPIFFVKSDDDFDAFCVRGDSRYAICINKNKPPSRIHFSILHEIGHYTLKTTRDLPIDRLAGSLYDERISEDIYDEFIANKFAQLFIIDIDTANKLYVNLNKDPVPVEEFQKIATLRHTSKDVIINSIYDVTRFRRRTGKYTARRNIEYTLAPLVSCDYQELIHALELKHSRIIDLIRSNCKNFSEDVYLEMMRTMQGYE